jgi:2-haloacid dehalogenase
VPAERICFLSSNGWDVAGAATFGFRVVWVNRARAPRECLPGAPAAEVGDLTGLIGLLPAPGGG